MSKSPLTLDHVCEFIVDCLHATASFQDEGYPMVRTPNIGKGRLNLEGVYRVSQETYEKWTRRAVPQIGDLILAREAPAGNVAIVKEGQQVCLGQRTVHLRPDPTRMDPDFLCYFLLAPKQQGAHLAALVPAGNSCLLYTSDAADERSRVDLGGRRIIKKKKHIKI